MTRDPANLGETLRSRWFSICLHVCLWLLVVLVVNDSRPRGSKVPFTRASVTSPPIVPVPVEKLPGLFVPRNPKTLAATPANPGFFSTTHFVPSTPPPPTPPPPPPPPPTTWKLELTYQGFYRTGDGPKYAVVRMHEKLVSIPVGSMLVTNLYVVDAAVRSLTLTNTAVQTNELALNTKQVIEVPLK